MIRIENLCKTYEDIRVLDNFSLLVPKGSVYGLMGLNGAGKTTLLKKIAEELLNRNDIKAEYMPQTYEDLLDLDVTPVDYLDKTGDKEERTRIRTYLGSLKYLSLIHI